MAGKKETKYKCCFCGHKSIDVGGVSVGKDFALTKDQEADEKFMKHFNRAIEAKVICPS